MEMIATDFHFMDVSPCISSLLVVKYSSILAFSVSKKPTPLRGANFTNGNFCTELKTLKFKRR